MREKRLDSERTLKEITDALLKPLQYASKDSFARLGSVKGLVALVERLCAEFENLKDPPDQWREGFSVIRGLFAGFDGLSIDGKSERILKALEVIAKSAQIPPSPPLLKGGDSIPSSPPLLKGGDSPPDPRLLARVSRKGGGLPPSSSALSNRESSVLPGPVLSNEKAPALSKVGAGVPRPRRVDIDIDAMLVACRTPLQYCKGIGPKLAERLREKGLATVEDALYFLPIRYEDRSSIKRIKDLVPGTNQTACGKVLAAGETRYGRRKVFEAAIGEPGEFLSAKWFNYRLSYMKSRLKLGSRVMLYGPVSRFGYQIEMVHPDVESLDDDSDGLITQIPPSPPFSMGGGGVVPVYSQIENFHQKTARKIIRAVVEGYADSVPSGVPDEVMRRHGLMDTASAFRSLHLPEILPGPDSPAKRALVFDELFVMELGMALRRASLKKEDGISLAAAGGRLAGLEDKLRALLPFKLTMAQEKVWAEIERDMVASHPMNRLIQGDVGSGKTVVALLAALRAVESGYQAAIMAPTEILSEQHYLTTHRYADSLGIKTLLITGSMKKAARKEALAAVAEGRVDLVIGTHALIQKDVEFARLGLVIIDEQHRFGVAQRAALRTKGADNVRPGLRPDVLIMTATPIPRTLCMTVFGDLDVSIIDELPPGRLPVETHLIKERDRARAYELLRSELEAGNQCYIVYPLVEESKELSLKDATRMSEHLQKDVFQEFKVGLLHGRMKAAEKEAVMREFKAGDIDVLVSTTVIEVGVDVPAATIMLIEHAERFGLAQLHQLRGRVGRGGKRSVCLLLAAWTHSEDTYRRLKVIEESQDGFRIAEEDLKLRGPGSFMSTQQAGMLDFRTAFALADLTILKKARDEAVRYLEKNPGLTGEGERIRKVLNSRWQGRLSLVETG
ncbi:MAG: ATP-dependent DNA helicase RecG [Deltaproteobacteria bacterium]|nr:ATP-dependent DNA helicase RecG [Deltaproteobacteria bacterium]